MNMVIFILLNLLNSLNAYLLLKLYFYFDELIDFLLAFSVLFYAQIVFLVTVLGSLNILFLSYILLSQFLLLLVLILLIKRTKSPFVTINLKFKPLNIQNNFKLTKIEVLVISFILGFSLVKIIVNLVNPPFGWDDLNYHFTFPVEWFKHGNLVNPITVNDYVGPTYYPINGSLIFFWLILPFKSVFLADLGQVPFFVIAFLSVIAIAKKLGMNKYYSFLSAALFTLTPNYFKQLSIAYVDVIVAALFLVGINFIMAFSRKLDFRNLTLSALSIGMLAGTKIITLPHAVFVFLFFIYVIFRNRQKLQIKKIISFIILFIFFTLILGGFPYLRNFILTKNFFYPLNIKILGYTIFKGVIQPGFSNTESYDFSIQKFLFHEGVGANFIIFVIPGIILALINIFKKKNVEYQIFFLVALIPLLYLIHNFVVALPNVRYLYPWFGICYIIALWGLSKFKIPHKVINILLIICLFASIAEIARHLALLISILILIILFIAFKFLLRSIVVTLNNPLRFIFLGIIFFVLLNLFFIDYVKNEYNRYKSSQKQSGFWPDAIDAWIWLNDNTNADNIAYVGRPVPFPLYGSNFKNNVFYVSVNEKPPILHAYKDAWYTCDKDYINFHKKLYAPNNYRGNASYKVWLNNLIAQRTNYLFVYSLHQTKTIEFPIEDIWATNYPEIFRKVFSNQTIHIYKINL